MSECYLSLVSLTYAYKAKESLRRRGISCRIVYTPEHLHTRGCGYSVAVQGDCERAAQVLRQDGIKILN
ncbi:DUF3343 domain-containing protein [Massiliimalia timonensis]|uniref:DUF3343 domain-containing protein n=1 Tax=Massiliimalia timonensis TaxID=1987501 RepID=UPI00189ECA8A|nr:DUF3343 domain-containing protein [Massiliimalia timonensis]